MLKPKLVRQTKWVQSKPAHGATAMDVQRHVQGSSVCLHAPAPACPCPVPPAAHHSSGPASAATVQATSQSHLASALAQQLHSCSRCTRDWCQVQLSEAIVHSPTHGQGAHAGDSCSQPSLPKRALAPLGCFVRVLCMWTTPTPQMFAPWNAGQRAHRWGGLLGCGDSLGVKGLLLFWDWAAP